jgi:hypothetical protein
LVSQVAETSCEFLGGFVLIKSIQVVWAEILIVNAVAEKEVRCGQDGGGDSYSGLFGPRRLRSRKNWERR